MAQEHSAEVDGDDPVPSSSEATDDLH